MRLVGFNIPDDKRTVIALTYIFGIGRTLSERILAETKIDPSKRAKDLTSEEQNKLKECIEKSYRIGGDLRRDITQNIRRKKDIGAYEGIRHMRGLPVRGQKTKTNTRTIRGNVRKTMGSGRKPAASKT